ncbi:hypothetical protein ILYODFUR_005120 [Ilyodon furcidens]|uniref:Secreted protein n=1 Tax=Ilyodon furcidens TaxID=33524 RepID=A0ABV0SWY3_9TELE
MMVGSCVCFCVSLGLGLLPLLDQFRPPIKCGGVCFGVCRLTPSGCLLGRGPPGSVGPDVPQGLRSRGPWLDLLQHRQLPAMPVGSSVQLPRASTLWLLDDSPGALLWGGCRTGP